MGTTQRSRRAAASPTAVRLPPHDRLAHATLLPDGPRRTDPHRHRAAVGRRVFTPAKALTSLLGERISARSLDDRAGCAVCSALARLAPVQSDVGSGSFHRGGRNRPVRAESIALRTSPARVYAVDELVASDSPLRPSRLGHLELGQGVAIRAIDNSGVSIEVESAC
ncbi:MAG: hypothetical protein R2724_16530 [Bryobacterales bacterium]